MAGGKSGGANVGKQLENVATNLSGHIIPEAGHWLPQEYPDEIAKTLIGFWRGASPLKRNWSFTRMLRWPARSPFIRSSRIAGTSSRCCYDVVSPFKKPGRNA